MKNALWNSKYLLKGRHSIKKKVLYIIHSVCIFEFSNTVKSLNVLEKVNDNYGSLEIKREFN